MDALQRTALEKAVDIQIKERQEEIMEAFLAACDGTDSTETACAKMISCAVGYSAKIATGLILEILMELGVAEPHDEERLRKNILSVVK